jgi:glutaminyl-peptide cyclotransferase
MPCLGQLRCSVTFCCTAFLAFFLSPAVAGPAPVDGYKVVATYSHSTDSYTEGFLYLDGRFYEGTGRNGKSTVIAYDLRTGSVVLRHDLPPEYFGEGVVDWGPYILEWPWKSEICFVYDRATLQLVTQFNYEGEGWGMTHTASELITSDGSATLTFRDPNTFQESHHIVVKDNGKTIDSLNELEFVKGEIYANIWHSDKIARISPQDGHVIAWIDLTGLLPAAQKTEAEAVLNGIAYDAQHDRLFVTGKLWPTIFEIKIVSHANKSPIHRGKNERPTAASSIS